MNVLKTAKAINIHPLYMILFSFIFLIISGTVLLMLPVAANIPVQFIDALFTSTSAVCVTGLVVFDTARDFTLFGKTVILLLIQFGGFGIMTFSLGLISLFRGDFSVKWRYTIKGFYSESGSIPISHILIRVIKYTFVFEAVTAMLLFMQFRLEYPLPEAVGHSVFHAVSAFCNAGFSTFPGSLISYQNNYTVIIVISMAIILGGIGFVVLKEISALRQFLWRPDKIKRNTLSLHTRIVLLMTVFLIVAGTVLLFVLERNNTMGNMSFLKAVLNAFFQSVSCRTAGFNSIDISSMRESSQLVMIVLMFIGGSPGSIAGGIKTTTFFTVMLFLFSKSFKKKGNSVFKRTLDEETVSKSLFLFILAITMILFSSFAMLASSVNDGNGSFLLVLFETVSAFGTVGLSMGITSGLTEIEKCILVFVMLAGRLGLFTIIMMIGLRKNGDLYAYPREHIMVG